MKLKMVNKISVFCLLSFMLFATAYAQDLSGYWQGRFRTDQRRNGASVTFFMNMVLIQNGRKIEGRFGNSELDRANYPNVVYEVSGIIGKKEKIPSRLIRGRILYNKIPDEVAEYFLSLDNIKYEMILCSFAGCVSTRLRNKRTKKLWMLLSRDAYILYCNSLEQNNLNQTLLEIALLYQIYNLVSFYLNFNR